MTATDSTYVIRRALAVDEPAFQRLVRSERLNPRHLYFQNFVVAIAGDELIGESQARRQTLERSRLL